MAAARSIKTKKRCCGSGPRCKRCPVVLKRLSKDGNAERLEGRLFLVHASKRTVKKARSAKPPAPAAARERVGLRR